MPPTNETPPILRFLLPCTANGNLTPHSFVLFNEGGASIVPALVALPEHDPADPADVRYRCHGHPSSGAEMGRALRGESCCRVVQHRSKSEQESKQAEKRACSYPTVPSPPPPQNPPPFFFYHRLRFTLTRECTINTMVGNRVFTGQFGGVGLLVACFLI